MYFVRIFIVRFLDFDVINTNDLSESTEFLILDLGKIFQFYLPRVFSVFTASSISSTCISSFFFNNLSVSSDFAKSIEDSLLTKK